jgi:hypothetical protein
MIPGSARNWIAVNAVQQSTLNIKMETKNITTLHLRKSVRFGFVLILIALVCVALSPTVHAVSPAPDGGYANANTAEGTNALFNLTTGFENTAIGLDALYSNTQGRLNTASGSTALKRNTTGANNTAIGARTLSLNTTGNDNTAIGIQALLNNNGDFNTATGSEALLSNTTGAANTASGVEALNRNTTGNGNTANGYRALFSNTTGTNTATGFQSLFRNTTGTGNVANGYNSLYSNSLGTGNIAIGSQALQNNTTGNTNTALGRQALHNTTIGTNNIAVGAYAGMNVVGGSSNIDIGNRGGNEANTIRIGVEGQQVKTFIAGIYGANAGTAQSVVVNSAGQLGMAVSSRRFKEDIKPMDRASEAILAMKPVTFHYKKEIDSNNTPQFGLVAEEVEKVNPDLVVRDKEGKPYSVRYDQVNAMLLNEFLKEHRKVQEQEATITQLNKDFRTTVTQLTARLDEQAAQIQKVSAQLEASKPAPQTVNNP